jgi:hypothetical protein
VQDAKTLYLIILTAVKTHALGLLKMIMNVEIFPIVCLIPYTEWMAIFMEELNSINMTMEFLTGQVDTVFTIEY